MCTRFVFRGRNIITGFNFDIDLSVWTHKVMKEKERFYIGILRPDGTYHSYHGVNRNGNAGTLLYVHGNSAGVYQEGDTCMTIADLTEQFIKAQISFDEVLQIVKSKKIVYAPDATMQAMLSDVHGRTLVIEPGIGYREEQGRYSLITNYSLIKPESTKDFIVPGDHRYEVALRLLDSYKKELSVSDAFALLHTVRQEGAWATRVSFVYSVNERTVYYIENNDFKNIRKFTFPVV
ncbi:MAG TPA: conjugal transfer protein [Candidatus Limivivens intestinipullorum]|uniref:Conjugal transfer protein n=1 Tax=Candidatus Limivivens intestinipullorum TaxID=2840858 RepID=A0A9D1JJS6_9FIRM|nr:conjugal transfer protein [Candidatus Limivivens intestinipullorum]